MVDGMAKKTAVNHEEPDGIARVLRDLAAVGRERAELERREAALVWEARLHGLVWQQIAIPLGVSKQAVHKKHRAGARVRSSGRAGP